MDKAQFSIDDYMKKLNDLFNQKQQSLSFIKEHMTKFNNLLKDEDVISQKIKKMTNDENNFDILKEDNLIQQDIELDDLDC